ncbi:MAG: hypothetical protein ABJN62_11370 [Halioglobus sp.]
MSDKLTRHTALAVERVVQQGLSEVEIEEILNSKLLQAQDPALSSETKRRLVAEAQGFSQHLASLEPPELNPLEHVERLKEVNPAASQALEHGLRLEGDYAKMQSIQSELDELGDDPATENKRKRLNEQMERALETTKESEQANPLIKRQAAVDALLEQSAKKRRESAQIFDVFDPEASDALAAEADEIGKQAQLIKQGGNYE